MTDAAYIEVQINSAKRRLDTALELIALGRNHEAGTELSSVSGKLDFLRDYVRPASC